MSLKTNNIAEIIVKHIQGKCTASENEILRRWSEIDPRNMDLLHKMMQTKSVEQSLSIFNKFDTDTAWLNIVSKSPVKRFMSYRLWATIAASIILVLGASIFVYKNFRSGQQDPLSSRIVASANPKYKNDILPAIEGATLLLANGEKVALSGEVTIEENGHILNADNNTIVELSESTEVIYHELIVPQTHFFSFKLADGSKVWVNANSKLRFPSRFIGDSRHVYLIEGEAYFEVEKNENQPFIVETAKANIKVLGTRFNVRNYQDDFTTTLAEGKVQVYNDDNSLDLKPRQKSINRDGKLLIRDADLTKDLAWKNNIFYFRNDNLKNVMQQIENWYGVQVVVDRSLQNNATYSGEIGRDVPLSEILNMLEFTSGLNFSLEGTKLYINSKR